MSSSLNKKTKNGKNEIFSRTEIFFIPVILLVILLPIILIIFGNFSESESTGKSDFCIEIEKGIKENEFFKENRIICKCYDPENYAMAIEEPEGLRNRTELKAIVECHIKGRKKIFPIRKVLNSTEIVNNITK